MDRKILAHLVAGIFGTAPVLSVLSPQAMAAGTDISNVPLANRRSDDLKSNIMLIYDDSNSMRWDYMPDSNFKYPAQGPGRRSNQCNTIFYNPVIAGYVNNSVDNALKNLAPYLVPEVPDATDVKVKLNSAAPTSFTSAIHNGYWTYDQMAVTAGSPSRGNLSTTTYWGTGLPPTSTAAVPSYYWRYTGSSTITPTSPECGLALVDASSTPVTGGCYLAGDTELYQYSTDATPSCTSPRTLAYKIAASSPTSFNTVTAICSDGATPPTYSFIEDGSTCASQGKTPVWERVVVSATSSLHSGYDERDRFANWYTYYRTRNFMAKGAIGRAFLPLVSKQKYRVGFITIKPDHLVAGDAAAGSVHYYDDAAPYNSKFLELRDFSSLNLDFTTKWFKILYAQRGNADTPLREGLARVGRYYAGKSDGPNTGMISNSLPDPMQYACQQNFSILTTDGTWDGGRREDGSDPAAGFKVDGTGSVRVGQQDGDLSAQDPLGIPGFISARPVYDGAIGYPVDVWDAENQYRYASCNWYLQSTVQNRVSTWQNLVSTWQNFQSTLQQLRDTRQMLASTQRNLANTSQVNQYTRQEIISTSRQTRSTSRQTETGSRWAQRQQYITQDTAQIQRSTLQTVRNTSQIDQILRRLDRRTVQQFQDRYWNIAGTTQILNATGQITQSTFQRLANTRQDRKTTTQLQQIVRRYDRTQARVSSYKERVARATSAINQSTYQARYNTYQARANTQQVLANLNQVSQTTLRLDQTTSQVTRSTRQLQQSSWRNLQTAVTIRQTTVQRRSCDWGDAGGASCQPVETCSPVTEFNTCDWTTTGPTPVASCTAASASSANNWATVSCSTSTVSASAPVASCTGQTANAGNSWIATVCDSSVTSAVPVSTCTSVAASSANSWTTTTCSTSSSANVPVASCTSATASSANSWTTTSCSTSTPTVSTTACASQTASSANSWTTISCATVANTTFVSSCTSVGPSAGNSYTTTSCSTFSSTNVPVASCTANTPGTANNWTTTTCPSAATTGPTPVSACTSAAASSANSWTTTTCATSTSAWVAAASCTVATAGSANSWTGTTCSSSSTGYVAAASCTSAAAASGNSWTTTTCSTSSSVTPVATCATAGASSANSWTTTTCATPTTVTGVTSCSSVAANSGNSYTTTSCSTPTTTTPVASCTSVAASSANSYTTTSCPGPLVGSTGVASCSSIAASSGNNWTTTTCGSAVSGPTAVGSCTSGTASSANSWTTTTCTTPAGYTPTGSCTPVSASSANGWTATLCSTSTGTAAVASCTPATASSSNSWVATTCSSSSQLNVPVASCTPFAGNSTNGWMTVTCHTNDVTVAAATCASQTASSGNSWITITCATPTSTLATTSCTSGTASSANSWTTTSCTTINFTFADPACTAASASSGNSWTTTTCSSIAFNNIPVASCTTAAPSSANSWTSTACATSTSSSVPVASCTASATANSANSYTVITCGTTDTGWVAAASCTSATASSANAYTTVTCSGSSYSNSAVASCASVGASAGNSYTTISCSTINTGPTAVAACTSIGASAGNSYTTTSCATIATGPSGIAACSAPAAASGNSYTTTTCSTAVTPNVPVQTCNTTAASSANSWTTTNCTTLTSTNIPVASCSAIAADSGNNWTNTSCPSPIINTNVPVAACIDTTADTANNWTTTTCASVVTSNVPVAACSSVAASSANNWTTTTCPATITTGPTAVAACTSIAADAGNNWTTTTCASSPTGPTPIATCNPITADSSNNWTTTTCSSSSAGPTPIATCTAATADVGNAYTTYTCDTANVTTDVPVQNCTEAAPSVANTFISTHCAPQAGYQAQYQHRTQMTHKDFGAAKDPSDFTDAYLVASQANDWTAFTSWTNIGQCGVDYSSAPTSLPTVTQLPVTAPLDTTTVTVSHPPKLAEEALIPLANVSCIATTDAVAAGTRWPCWLPLTADTSDRSDTLADVAQYYYATDLRSAALGTENKWGCTPPATGPNTCSVAENIVPPKGSNAIEDNKATWQHMTTFTIGLGVSGNIPYNPSYKKENPLVTPPTNFQSIRCPSNTSCIDWPAPNPTMPNGQDSAEWSFTMAPKRVDDLWHAAVNGRGGYFSASDPQAVATGLAEAFKGMEGESGYGTGGTASTLEPILGDDITFNASFMSVKWYGDVDAQVIETSTTGQTSQGSTKLDSSVWKTSGNTTAAGKLSNLVGSTCDDRKIFLFRNGGVYNSVTTNFVPFTWNTLRCSGSDPAATDLNATEQAVFAATNFPQSSWGQYLDLTSTQRDNAQNANLVNYLRGQRGMELTSNDGLPDGNHVFRARDYVLGDIVNSQPVYVRPPNGQNGDLGYAGFKSKTGIVDRPSVLLVGANDGMLHALHVTNNTTTSGTPDYTYATDPKRGTERWAFIPSPVLSKLYKLASSAYDTSHDFFVDGPIATADVYDKNGGCASGSEADCWKTVAVGALGAGGRGYYALDVTDPVNPKALWEFNWTDNTCVTTFPSSAGGDCHVGLTYGKPLITKLPKRTDGTDDGNNGRWVALLTSGYNNNNSTAQAGDGQGYLYVVDVISGQLLYKLGLGAGGATTGVFSSLASSANTITVTPANAVSIAALVGSGTNVPVFSGGLSAKIANAAAVDTSTGVITLSNTSASWAGVGSNGLQFGTGTSAGFAHINAYVDNYLLDNTAQRVYGGDLLGNVWRINLRSMIDEDNNSSTAAVYHDLYATLLTTVKDSSGTPQPITTRPQLMDIGALNTKMVYVGTGRYLGDADITGEYALQTQSVYAIPDNISIYNGPVITAPRTTLHQVTLTPNATNTERTASCTTCANGEGWFVDLPETGERINVEMRLALGTLSFPSNVPNVSACDTGGSSWTNYLSASSGLGVANSSSPVSARTGGSFIVGVSYMRFGGRIVSVITYSKPTPPAVDEVPVGQTAPLGRPVGWRDVQVK